MNDRDDKFEDNICRLLDQSVDDLGADVEFKLGRLKYRAMSSTAAKKSWRPIWGSAFMTAALLLIVLINLPQNRQTQMASPSFTELDILTAKESLEFYAEDIEFYEWLSEVLENEPDVMGEHTSVPTHTDPANSSGGGEGRNRFAQSGADRVSRDIRG
jgi:hypothetical protein